MIFRKSELTLAVGELELLEVVLWADVALLEDELLVVSSFFSSVFASSYFFAPA